MKRLYETGTATEKQLDDASAAAERSAAALSGGMKKKLALACTLVHTPELILLDEPTTGVDPVSRGEFWNILGGILKQGVTVLMTTPYMDEAERCDRVGLVSEDRQTEETV